MSAATCATAAQYPAFPLYRATPAPYPMPSRWPRPSHPAMPAAWVSTRRARGSDRWASRKATGSAPAAAASSSMNDSIANTFRCAPSERSEDVRIGMSSSRCRVTWTAGMS